MLDVPVSELAKAESNPQQASSRDTIQAAGPEQKRKYRRHPRPDEHAPEKAPSAYVLFSNTIREEVKHESLSFTEIARLVGERWQKLDPSQKEPFETHAASLKDTYNAQLAQYKKTDAYRDYMQYLADFKAKHGTSNEVRSEYKRPKLDAHYSSSLSAASANEMAELTCYGTEHVRGASIGSVGSVQTGISPATIQLATVLPGPGAPGGRRRSPTNPYTYGRRPGQLSNESSLSEDYGDPLPRAAALSLSTPPTGTPPPSMAADRLKRQELGYGMSSQPWQRESSQTYPLGFLSGTNQLSTLPTTPSGLGLGDPVRDRGQETTGAAYTAGPLPQRALPISQLVGANVGRDPSTMDVQRILPPLSQLAGAYPQYANLGQPSVSIPITTYQNHAPPDPASLRPGHIRSMPSRSESEAADTLAGLSERQSFSRSRTPRSSQ